MAVDKLVDSSQLDTDLTSVANAIRTKGGTSAQLAFPSGFVSAVEAIPTGGGATLKQELLGYTPTGDVYYVPDADIPRYGIMWKKGMTSLTLDFANGYSFAQSNSNGENICNCSIPKITIIGNNSGSVVLWGYCITACSSPFVVVCKGKLYKYSQSVFRANTGLTTLDYTYTSGNGITKYDFYGDSSFGTLIIRGSTMMPLADTSAFSNATKFRSGGAGGTLYVPQSLIASYEAATNWSTILGYTNNQILPIEGSIYETQYADGTPIA